MADQPAQKSKQPQPAKQAQQAQQTRQAPAQAKLDLSASRQFPSWLNEHNVSIAFTTYQAGKLFLIGLRADGRMSIVERTYTRCMGLWASRETLLMTSLYQLWRFENALQPGQTHQGYDRLYVPQVGYTTGDIDAHDVGVDKNGRIIFVNTLFSCLATVSESHSFVPLWKPPYISKLAAEDRCHMNGLAMVNGRPGYVTSVGQTDVTDGWRDRRGEGGCLVDVQKSEIVLSGLSMPHSPRYHAGKIWLLESGTGYFGTVDLENRKFQRMTFCPGYARGMSFIDNFALIGLSKARQNRTFSDLELDDNLAAKDAEARCGILVIDLRTGDIVHWVRFEGAVSELYDVAVLRGVRRPMALGFRTDQIRRTITLGGRRKARRAPAAGQQAAAGEKKAGEKKAGEKKVGEKK